LGFQQRKKGSSSLPQKKIGKEKGSGVRSLGEEVLAQNGPRKRKSATTEKGGEKGRGYPELASERRGEGNWKVMRRKERIVLNVFLLSFWTKGSLA